MESTLEDQGLSCSPRFWEGSGDALATVSTHPHTGTCSCSVQGRIVLY
jgi:hypothetical protein